MFKSNRRLCIFVSLTHSQSKYHAEMLVDMLKENPELNDKYTYNPHEGVVTIMGKPYKFMSYEYYTGPCFGRGLSDYEVFKDHLVYGIN